MVWSQVLVLSIAFLAFYVWMAFALGAVFAKLGVTPGAAWIPVRRYVVAARAAELPTAPVWISRCVAAVAWLAFAVVVLLRASDAVAGSSGLRAFAALAFALGALGSLVGWTMWIATANRLELRLVVQRQLWWLAALLPPAWASVIGFGGTRQAVGGPVVRRSRAVDSRHRRRTMRRVLFATSPPRSRRGRSSRPRPSPRPNPSHNRQPEPEPEPKPEPKPNPNLNQRRPCPCPLRQSRHYQGKKK